MNIKQTNKVLSCFEVANYFLVLVDREAGDCITQLKLQKLIYLAQGINLALFDKPLFNEPIEAWIQGPVVRNLRATFGNFQAYGIPAPGEIDFDVYNQQQKEIIYKIYSTYGEHSAAYLRNLINTHYIWQEAINNSNQIISQEKMHKFFKNDIEDIKVQILSVSEKDILQIENAEDQWWMNYDCGVPV